MKKKEITLITDLSKSKGGANIAALRIAKVLKKNFEIKIISPDNNIFAKMKILISKMILKIFVKNRDYLNSLNIFSRVDLKNNNHEILHIHWIGNETISIEDLIKTKKKILWTMHDMWPVTSTEHFLKNPKQLKYTFNDTRKNMIKKIIFRKKKKLFKKKNIYLVTNSKWLENFAKRSDLGKGVKIKTIYNPVETELWRRKNEIFAKKKLKLNTKKNYIFFGAQGGINNPRKGGEFFLEALSNLKNFDKKLEIIVLGGSKNYSEKINDIKINYRKLEINKKIQCLYHSAACLTVSTSKAESLPQFVVETILCRNPVITFDIGGIKELVDHKFNGYIAKNYNISDLSRGIKFCLKSIHHKNLIKAENKVRNMFNEKKIFQQYNDMINNI